MRTKTDGLAARLLWAGMLLAVVVTLTACGVSNASHAVQGTSRPIVSSTTAVTAAAGAEAAGPRSGLSGASPASGTSTAPGIDQQTLDQMASELGALDNSLNSASSHLNNPQGDN